jgi:glycerol kinase
VTAAPHVQAILAIDQGTTNSKAVLVTADGRVLSTGSAPVGVSAPRPGWIEQDAERIWTSVRDAVAACRSGAPDVEIAGIALSTQRESVAGWRAGTGQPVGPVIGWQDHRTTAWCAEHVTDAGRQLVYERTGLRVDPMFSAPKMRWLLDHLPAGTPLDDVRLGTVDAYLIWRLTGGARHLCEAGNASRTLLYDIADLDWSADLRKIFGVPATALPTPLASDAGFGTAGTLPQTPVGTPILAVLADSHAALYGHGCTTAGTAKATYGTGSSVMAPIDARPAAPSSVPTTLAWVIGGAPTYALEGNILFSGAALTWAADVLTGGRVGDLIALAATVPDSGGVTLVPAFAGLGAPHWDRGAHAVLSGMRETTGRAHLARAAVDAVGHQICDVVDVIEQQTARLRLFRADGGATASDLVVQTQADLLGRDVQVGEVTEISAVGAARLAWATLGQQAAWPATGNGPVYRPALSEADRQRRRRHWAGEVRRTRFDGSRS